MRGLALHLGSDLCHFKLQARMSLPTYIESESELESLLTQPSSALVNFIRKVSSPLLVLGAGGKMGPTLAVLAKRAAEQANHPLEVIAVSRFSDEATRSWLEEQKVKTFSCDLLDRNAIGALPNTQNIIYLVGLKFGTADDPSTTWAMNTLVPANIAERFQSSRIVALSTGNVYPLSDVSKAGSLETDPLTPIGEYPNAAVARERLFEFFSRRNGTSVALVRLFYAVELRYGILVDLAQRIVSGEAIDLANGSFNCIWQGDANEMIIRSLLLAASPPSVWNLCSPEIYNVRSVAVELGDLMGIAPMFKGAEAPTALLGNSHRLCSALATSPANIKTVLRWTAAWVKSGGRNLNKPTHFETRDGKY
jgi:nucleoside-diphosphate-sugar epimerase